LIKNIHHRATIIQLRSPLFKTVTPYAFIGQGVSMRSRILNSKRAIHIKILSREKESE